jgi:hypothetical protein
MKKIIFAIFLPLITLSAFANTIGVVNNDPLKKTTTKTNSISDNNTALKKWEATPDGIAFKKWEASAAGKKVYASEAKIRKSIREFTNMEALVINLTLPPGSRLGFGMMVKINEEDYILSFGPDLNNEFQNLHRLNVGDKIIIKSHSVSHAPKYTYPIVAGDYIERDGKVLYKRIPKKGGC